MYTLFATKKAGKYSRLNTCCQIFVSDKGFVCVVQMTTESQVLQAVNKFSKEIGAPDAIISNLSKAQNSSYTKKSCNDIGTTMCTIEENTLWSNKAELYIGIIKEAVRKDMKDSNSPLSFWDYCVERSTRINNITVRGRFNLGAMNVHTQLTGEEAYISALWKFGWYKWCYYRDNTAKFTFGRELLGKFLEPARGQGNELSQWILKWNDQVIPIRTYHALQVAETHKEEEIEKRKIFEKMIESRWVRQSIHQK